MMCGLSAPLIVSWVAMAVVFVYGNATIPPGFDLYDAKGNRHHPTKFFKRITPYQLSFYNSQFSSLLDPV